MCTAPSETSVIYPSFQLYHIFARIATVIFLRNTVFCHHPLSMGRALHFPAEYAIIFPLNSCVEAFSSSRIPEDDHGPHPHARPAHGALNSHRLPQNALEAFYRCHQAV
jgi:hypothetical protein